MKRILFVTTRNPYSGRYSGDVIRSLKIINFLRKKFELDVVSLTDKHLKISDKRFIQFKYPNFFLDCYIVLLLYLNLNQYNLDCFSQKR